VTPLPVSEDSVDLFVDRFSAAGGVAMSHSASPATAAAASIDGLGVFRAYPYLEHRPLEPDDDITDWYALAYDRRELEFEEARTMARQTLERGNELALVVDLDPVRIARARERRWIRPVVDERDLGGGERDDLEALVVAIDGVEVMEVAACGSHDEHSTRHRGSFRVRV